MNELWIGLVKDLQGVVYVVTDKVELVLVQCVSIEDNPRKK